MLQNDRYKKFCNRRKTVFCGMVFITGWFTGLTLRRAAYRLYKPVSDWLEMLPLDSTGLNM